MKRVSFFTSSAIVLLFAVSFSSCKKAEKCDPFILIVGSDSGGCFGGKQEKIITSQKEWENFIMPLPKSEIDRFRETEIDFYQYQIIAVIDNVRPDTGWSMYVSCVTEYSSIIVVTVIIRRSCGKVHYVEIHPYYILKIPVTEKSIEFEFKYIM